MVDACEKSVEYRRQLRFDVAHGQALHVKAMPASFAVPGKAVQFIRAPPPLDDDADAVCRALRRVRHLGRQEQHLALADRDVGDLSVLHDPQHHRPLDLEEQFLAGIVMKMCIRDRVHARVEDGDAFFSGWRGAQWRESSRERHPADERNEHPYSFITLDRDPARPEAVPA